MIGRLASSLSIQSAMPPKLMQPRQSLETCVPVAPIRTYFIGPILVWEMLEDRRSGADGVSRPALPRRVLLDRDQSALIGGARGWRGGPREAAMRSRSSTARGRGHRRALVALLGVSAPAIRRDALVGQPQALRRRGGLPEDVDRDAAARVPVGADP